MFGLLDWAKIGGGVILGMGLAFGPVYFYGKAVGKTELASELQADRVEILKDGKQVDEKAYAADDASLCALLGGCELPDSEPVEPVRRFGPGRPEAGDE